MKKNLVSILLFVTVIIAPYFLERENAIYWQIFQFLWIAFYFGFLADLDKNDFSNKDEYFSLRKFIWRGVICRILPLGLFIGECGVFAYQYEFLLSTVISMLIASVFFVYTLIFALKIPVQNED